MLLGCALGSSAQENPRSTPFPKKPGEATSSLKPPRKWQNCRQTSLDKTSEKHWNGLDLFHLPAWQPHDFRGVASSPPRVVVPAHKRIRPGTLRQILKDAGLTIEQPIALL